MIKEKVKQQLVDMRKFNKLTSNGEKPELDSHLEACLLLGIPYVKRNAFAFQMPFWDTLEMYQFCGNKIPNRMYLLLHFLYDGDMETVAKQLFTFGYNNMYNKTYKELPFSEDKIELEVPIETCIVPTLGSRWEPAEPYRYIVVESVFNPYPTIFYLFDKTGKWYEPNFIYEKYSHQAKHDSKALLEFKEKINKGYNPMFGKYTIKHKFEILEEKREECNFDL